MGSLLVYFRAAQSSSGFTRNGADLYSETIIPVWAAILGYTLHWKRDIAVNFSNSPHALGALVVPSGQCCIQLFKFVMYSPVCTFFSHVSQVSHKLAMVHLNENTSHSLNSSCAGSDGTRNKRRSGTPISGSVSGLQDFLLALTSRHKYVHVYITKPRTNYFRNYSFSRCMLNIP